MRQLEDETTVMGGTFMCLNCGYRVSLEVNESAPICPTCDSREFGRSSMFSQPNPLHAQAESNDVDWLQQLRSEITNRVPVLAYRQGNSTVVVEIDRSPVRVGRGITADIRLDSPTVSRRHALIHVKPGGTVAVLDDRSLNGVYVRGDRVQSADLHDGDDMMIGSFHMHLVAARELSLAC